MRTTQMGGAAALGATVLGCFGSLVHCGGGNGDQPGGGDKHPDTTTLTPDAAPDPGSDASEPTGDDDAAPPARQSCKTAASCTGPSTETCCGGYCVDTAADPANCGQCGVSCKNDQFCTGTACDTATLATVCSNAKGTVADDAYDQDNQAGAAIGAALSADCTPPVSVLETSQDAEGILDPSSGRPITGAGNTFITGGGGYGQNGVAYMETAITPLYLWGDGTTGEIRTRAGKALVTTAVSDLTAHHDFFYVQVSVEPRSSTLCLSAVGMLSPGTLAAGYYAGAELIPNRAKYTASWYVFEWSDANGDSTANAGDTFTLVMAGP